MAENNFARLTEEIKDFEKYLKPTQFENDCRDQIVRKIRRGTMQQLPDAKVYAFGSCETKLLLPSSDVDIAVDYPNNEGKTPRAILRTLQNVLRRYIWVEHVVPAATVPVLKCVDRQSQLGVDITIQSNTSSSTRTVSWIKQYPELKPLFLVLKHALLGIQLEFDPTFKVMDASRGGVASYVLVCLIVHYIKYNEEAKKSTDPATRLGKLLVGFLKFYATFDFKTMGLTFSNNSGEFDLATSTLFKPPKIPSTQHRMNIENPDEPDQNVARACMSARKFQVVLLWMHGQLQTAVESNEPQKSILPRVVTVEPLARGAPRKTLHDYKFPVKVLKDNDLSAYVIPGEFPKPGGRKRKLREENGRGRFEDKRKRYKQRWP